MANFGISEKIGKIETFISENLKIFGYDLNFLVQDYGHVASDRKLHPIRFSSHTIDRTLNQLDWVTNQAKSRNDNFTQNLGQARGHILLATTAPKLSSHSCHGSDITCK